MEVDLEARPKKQNISPLKIELVVEPTHLKRYATVKLDHFPREARMKKKESYLWLRKSWTAWRTWIYMLVIT